MRIGKIEFAEPFVMLAPLAGYGDAAFRRICRECGASLTVTEMISAKGLCYGNAKTEGMLGLSECESPSCVQLFGSEPEFFARALSLGVLDKFDIIDINMGCPVPKVTKCGEGSALMRDASRAAEVVSACVSSAGGRPVTVKHRLGYRDCENNAVEFALALEKAGAAAVTVHGRTAEQGYRGFADWDSIASVARALSVPVIGNGDITSSVGALEAIEKYGVSGVAIGRGAIGNPAVFGKSSLGLCETVLRHLEYELGYFPERMAVPAMRKHIAKYLAGISGVKELKARLYSITDAKELKEQLTAALCGK